MADIFISYKSDRRPAARHLKKVLDCYFQTGTNECVWYDYGLVPGDDFEPRIMSEIANAKVVLVLWCELAVKSDWVLKEALEAHRTGKFLPVRIENCVLPIAFAGADTINLVEWDAAPRHHMLDRLLHEIGRRIGREATSPISRLRELEEDWRGYGAPSLAQFALGKALEPGSTPRVQQQNAPSHRRRQESQRILRGCGKMRSTEMSPRFRSSAGTTPMGGVASATTSARQCASTS